MTKRAAKPNAATAGLVDRMKADPREFRRRLVIDINGQSRRLIDAMDPWQAADFEALDGGWQAVAGQQPYRPAVFRAYLERGRGHSKSTDNAIMATYALFASPRRVAGFVAAGDRDQARLVLDAIKVLTQLNPWLNAVLDVQRNSVVNRETGSELSALTADAPTSYGLLPDFCLCDELSVWPSEALWHSLFSAAAKRGSCMLVCISNAGMGLGSSWTWNAREAARTSDGWYFSRLDGPVASWITPDRLAEQEKFLPRSAFKRLWLNEWVTEAGDAITEEDLRAAIDDTAGPLTGYESGYRWCCGVDIGVKRDRTGIVVLGVSHGRIRLAHCKSWAPGPAGEVNLSEVLAEIVDISRRFNGVIVGYDPSQMSFISQEARKAQVYMREVPFVGRHLDKMASAVVQGFSSHAVTLYPQAELLRDLRRLVIVQKTWGLKLEAPRTRDGHCDLGTGFAIAASLADEALLSHSGPIVIDGFSLGAGPFTPRMSSRDRYNGGPSYGIESY